MKFKSFRERSLIMGMFLTSQSIQTWIKKISTPSQSARSINASVGEKQAEAINRKLLTLHEALS